MLVADFFLWEGYFCALPFVADGAAQVGVYVFIIRLYVPNDFYLWFS